MVHTHHKHRGISTRVRDEHFLAPPSKCSLAFPSGLHHVFSSSITHFDVGVSFLNDGDGLSIGDKLPVLSLDCATELVMGRITLEHVDRVVESMKGSLMAKIYT